MSSVAPHERLREARERAGYNTASEFARNVKLNYTTYAHHENGRRDMKPDVARLYARLLNLPPGTLLYGEQLPTLPSIPIIGDIIGVGKIQTITPKVGRSQTVKLPDPLCMVSLIVRGDDLYPAYRDGDVVFYRPLEDTKLSLESLNGLECVVRLADQREMLRILIVQHDDRATLTWPNLAPMVNQTVVAASPVELVQKYIPRPLARTLAHRSSD